MLRHVVVFTWKPGVTVAQVEALTSGLARLPSQIPEIRAYRFGPDAGLYEGNGAYAVSADFDDPAAFARYLGHPAHQALIDDLVVPIRATRHAVQFEYGP